MANKLKVPIEVWTQIKSDYVIMGMTARALVEKYAEHGLAQTTIERRAERHKWGAERRRHQADAENKIIEEMGRVRVQELIKFNTDDLKIAKALRARVVRRLTDAEKEGGQALGTSELRQLASVCETAQKMGRLALGATTQNNGIPDTAGAAQGDGTENAPSIVDVPIDQIDPAIRDEIIVKYLGSLAP